MPDKVLICSKANEAQAPKSIYSNKQMNTFFGCNVVRQNSSVKTTESKKKKKDKPLRLTGKSAIKRRIFSNYKPNKPLPGDSTGLAVATNAAVSHIDPEKDQLYPN